MSKEFKVGLMAVISGAIFYFGFNFLKGIDFFSTSNKFYAIYSNIDGLNVSNPVIINGFSIGRVSDIRILQKHDNKVIVELDVKGDLVIGAGTTATLMNSDFLGSKAILLEIGDISQPLNPGDTLKSDVDKGLAALMERAQPLTDNISLTISRMNEILHGMEGTGEEIKGAIKALRTTTESVNHFVRTADRNVNETIVTVTTLTKNINDKVSMLDPILENANNTLEMVNRMELDTTLISLNASLDELNVILVDLNEGKGSMGKILKSDSLHTNLNQMLVDLDKLLIHFNENPKHFMAPLGKSKKKIAKDLKKEDD